jgi:condensin complex subunit 2
VENVLSRNISVTLADFKFSSDAKSAFDISLLMQSRDDEDDEHVNGNAEDGAPAGEAGQDFFGGDDAGMDNDFPASGDFYHGGDDDNDAGDMGDGDLEMGMGMGPGPLGPVEPFDPRRQNNGSGLVMSMDDGEGLMLDYFDQGYLKNWAGPEHWKLRRVRRGETW